MINLNTNNNLINKVVGKKFNKKFLGVSINSKTIKKNLFIAIRGKNNDGHKFIKEACLKGASACVVSQKNCKISKNKKIKVQDTYKFLKSLAFQKRKIQLQK